jgi:pyruvate,water dikinase
MVAGYLRTGSYKTEDLEERERQIRSKAEGLARERLTWWQAPLFFWILRQTRKAVKNRENLRFARTKIFGVCRNLFRAIGSRLAELGVIQQREDIFYLTVEEIFAFLEGRGTDQDLSKLCLSRRACFAHFDATPSPPDRFMTTGAAGLSFAYPALMDFGNLIRAEINSDDPNSLHGTPCCPGIVEGFVRVVKSMADAHGLDGEILVTSRTDPGWVPLYPSCSGLLIERGSLLSHSAVVARELGLPTIVGISGGLMDKLKTGDRVRMDASQGIVKILREPST